MVRTPKPKPDLEAGAFLPNGAASKAGLNRGILDAGWGVFLGILAQKAESAARVLIPVDPRSTSRTYRPSAGTWTRRTATARGFQCTSCQHIDHADRVGAWNVALQGRAGSSRRGIATDQGEAPDLSGEESRRRRCLRLRRCCSPSGSASSGPWSPARFSGRRCRLPWRR
ncbi:zinc ribbon domain-containing protein [Streptomyces sp. KL116D]|uniref:zinc ribbon domain-containing protein n=1 Tax=Streptomyces sp. KL116D TaxID=3045152 RepID=UPI00355745A9